MQTQARDVLAKLESAVSQLSGHIASMPEAAGHLGRINEQVQALLAAGQRVIPSACTAEELEAVKAALASRESELGQARTQLDALALENNMLREQLAGFTNRADSLPENVRQKYEQAADEATRRLREALRDRDEAHQEIVALRGQIEVLKRANASLSVPVQPEAAMAAESAEEAVPVLDANGHKRRIGEILVNLGAITDKDRDEALGEQTAHPHRRLGAILVERHLVSEELVARIVARQLDLPFIRLTPETVEPAVAQLLGSHIAKRHLCIPISISPTHIVLAMANPFDLIGIEDVELATGRRVEPTVATQCDIIAAIARIYDE